MGLSLRGTTSGAVDINAPAVAGDNTITLPGNNGSANQFYKNSGTAGIVTHSSMVEDSSGNVGIGTDDPTNYYSNDLVVAGGSEGGITIGGPTTGQSYLAFADGTVGNERYRGYMSYNHASDNLIFASAVSERMRLDSSGRLLVGTATSPTAGNGQYANIVVQGYPSTPQGAGHISLQRGQAAFGVNNQIGLINFGDNTGASYAGIECYADADSGANDYPGRLVFSTTADGASSPTERLRLDSSGNFGIGTASPNAKLQVNSGDIYITARASSTETGIFFRNPADTATYAKIGYTNTTGNLVLGTTNTYSTVFVSNDTERMRIDSAGNVGLNCTAPGSLLELNAAAATVMGISLGTVSDNITASRYIGICNNTDQTNLGANSGFSGIEFGGPNSTDEGYLAFHTHDNGAVSAERMRLTKNGRMLLGGSTESAITAAQQVVYTTGITNVLLTNTASGGWNCINSQVSNSGTYYFQGFLNASTLIGSIRSENGTTTNFNTSSDYRLKENIIDITGAIDRVKQLSPRRFNFIADPDRTVDGFVAHEAQTVIPEAVHGTKDEVDDNGEAVMQGIDQSKLVPLLTAALQEAITKIETLETQNADLLSRVTALEG